MIVRKKISENFYWDEFECNCGCGMDSINLELVDKIQKVRDEYGPIRISSGCSCKAWNEKEGGKPDSAHLKGLALDVVCNNSSDRYRLLTKLTWDFRRIGVHKSFIHVDIDSDKPEEVIWVY